MNNIIKVQLCIHIARISSDFNNAKLDCQTLRTITELKIIQEKQHNRCKRQEVQMFIKYLKV